MRSIRLSLLAWFLGLLTLALGGVSLFVYHSSSDTLQDKKVTTEKLLLAQYKERCADEEKKLETKLLDQARVLASARFHFDRERWRYRGLSEPRPGPGWQATASALSTPRPENWSQFISTRGPASAATSRCEARLSRRAGARTCARAGHCSSWITWSRCSRPRPGSPTWCGTAPP